MIPTITLLRLVAAISMVESHGNARAHNPQEHAVGHLQIRQCVIDDVNRLHLVAGGPFTLIDAYNPKLSIMMCEAYLRYWTLLTNQDSAESAARIWNGGPDGWWKLSTLPYWYKIQAELDRHDTIVAWQHPPTSPSPVVRSAFTLDTTAASSSQSVLAITFTFDSSASAAKASPSISFSSTIKPSVLQPAPRPASRPPTSHPAPTRGVADYNAEIHFSVNQNQNHVRLQ